MIRYCFICVLLAFFALISCKKASFPHGNKSEMINYFANDTQKTWSLNGQKINNKPEPLSKCSASFKWTFLKNGVCSTFFNSPECSSPPEFAKWLVSEDGLKLIIEDSLRQNTIEYIILELNDSTMKLEHSNTPNHKVISEYIKARNT